MFSEILRIKPVLDDSTAKQMENSLHSRFSRVAGKFGSGLKSVIKGSILGISLGLLNKILNPIEELDTKIKGLLGHGMDVKNLAERLGAPSGEVEQLHNVAKSFGFTTDQFTEMVGKFADTIEKAREEIANPFQEKSPATMVLAPFANEPDKAKSFKSFMTFLQTVGQGQGKDQPLTAHAARVIQSAQKEGKPLSEEDRQKLIASGELRRLTGIQAMHAMEKDVFGAQQFGPARKLIEANIDEQAKLLKQPSIDQLSQINDKLAGLEAQKLVLDVQNQTKDMMEASKRINEDMIKAMSAAEARSASETTERLGAYNNLKKGADAVADIQQGFSKLLDAVSVGLGYLKNITAFIPKIEQSPMVKGILKTFSKGN